MEPGPHPKIGAQKTPKLAPVSTRKAGIPVGYDYCRDAVQLTHMLPIQLGGALGCNGLAAWDEVRHLYRLVDDRHNCIHPSIVWQPCDEVDCHVFPLTSR